MLRRFKTVLTVVGAVTVLVLAGNTLALATTGHALIVGKSNKATKLTTLKRTKAGPALKVQTRSSTDAPFVVNGGGTVANLDADEVDGVDASDLQTRTLVFTAGFDTYDNLVRLTLPLPEGTWLVSFAAHLKMQSQPHGDAECYLTYLDASDTFFADTTFEPGSFNPSLTGSDLVRKLPGVPVALQCTSATNFITATNLPLKVVATRVDQVTEVAPTVTFP